MIDGMGAQNRVYPADFVARLCCARCRGKVLSHEAQSLLCESCGAPIRYDDGILRFTDVDPFYEGVYEGEIKFVPDRSLVSKLKLHIVNTHYLSYVQKHVSPGVRLLELGCGGGARYLAHHTRATGVDLSVASLKKIHPSYEGALQADALHLPLMDGSYDAVTSAYFYEHIAVTDKPALLKEIRRVLRPGGRVVFLFDTASESPLFRWLRREPRVYEQCFIEHDHHYGLETVTANVARFQKYGFRVLDMHCANKTPLQHLAVYSWMRPYETWATDVVANAAAWVSERATLQKGYTVGLTLFDDIVESILPRDWARIMLVALERA